jgi:hypothetical protein
MRRKQAFLLEGESVAETRYKPLPSGTEVSDTAYTVNDHANDTGVLAEISHFCDQMTQVVSAGMA